MGLVVRVTPAIKRQSHMILPNNVPTEPCQDTIQELLKKGTLLHWKIYLGLNRITFRMQ